MPLTASQRAALDHVRAHARARRAEAVAQLDHVRRMADLSAEDLDALRAALRAHARVALHLHPDRLGPGGVTVAAALRAEGVYRSQFETGLSNGKVDPTPGGARDLWEARLFGGAYPPDTPPGERPRYGALDLLHAADGPAPRFGSCYLLCRPEVGERCTFTYQDSHQDPPEKGTLDEPDDLLAALLGEVFLRDAALGEAGLTPASLVRRLLRDLPGPRPDPAGRAPSRNLNHYIEAQVHGPVHLAEDVEALVADPSFRGTAVGADLEGLAATFDLELRWHPGFRLRPEDTPTDFRGPTMPALAARVARGGVVDAAALGAAAREAVREPARWGGDTAAALQELKLLWHCLVRCG